MYFCNSLSIFFVVPMQKLLPAAAAKIPNFVGLKFTSRDCAEAGSCTRLKRSNGKPYTFYFGSDEVYLDNLLILLINLFLIIICKIVLCTILVYLIMKLFTPTRLILVIMDLELNLQSVHLIILLLNYSIK